MLAGGCVRDHLLGITPKDYDLASTALPESVMSLFSSKGYQVIPIGIDHGTVSVVTPIQHVEITTLRKDVACFGRKAEVSFGTSFEEDALRRDFTINALFMDADKNIHDYTGGQQDLAEHRLVFVGDPDQRIQEDYLRSLRYFRFLARLGWRPQSAALHAIKENKSGLTGLSSERIHAEMEKILVAPHRVAIIKCMVDAQVLQTLFPWFDPNQIKILTEILNQAPSDKPLIPWLILFYYGASPKLSTAKLDNELDRLRFSRSDKKIILGFTRILDATTDPYHGLFLILRISRNKQAPLEELNDLLKCYGQLANQSVHPAWFDLIDGIRTKDAPPLAPSEILKIPEQDRGKNIEMAKIYWYLNLCHATKQPKDILGQLHQFTQELKSKLASYKDL